MTVFTHAEATLPPLVLGLLVFFNDTATTEIYPLSLHDALPIFGLEGHPARFPAALPEFFIKFLTDHDDLVLDIFAGSNTTGRVAEQLGRRWMAMELDANYVAASALRFMDHLPESNLSEPFGTL